MSTLITNIGELVTNDPEADDLLGIDRARRPRRRRRPVAWVGPAADAPAADQQVDAGGRAVLPGFVDSHSPPGLRRRPRGGVRGPDGRRAVRRRRHPHHRRRHPRRPPTSSSPPTSPGWSQEMRRQGTTTVEIKSGYGLTVHDEARSLAVARQFTEETTYLGAHVVPDGRPRRVRRPGHRADARGRRAARPLGRRVLRDAARSTPTRPGRSSTAGAAAGPAAAAARQPARPRARRPARRRARAHRRRPLHLPDRRRRARAPRQRHHRDPAPRRRVLDPPALPRRPRAARRRRRGRPRLRLQPRLVLHVARCRCASRSRSGRWG